MDELDRRIVNALLEGIAVEPEPFRATAEALGLSQETLLERVGAMRARGELTRFGPMYQAERMGGAFVLAALGVPEARFDEVAEAVNALPEVAHNYRREHRLLNMWFVLAAESEAVIDAAIARIERDTGLTVYAFPKEREFFVELKLPA